MKTVKCEVWKLYIVEGALGMSHGHYLPLQEYYMPKYNVSFNQFNHNIHILPNSKNRYRHVENSDPREPEVPIKIDTIEIPEVLAKSLKKYVVLKEKIDKDIKKIVKEYEQKYENLKKQ